jgi:hypothetical protein
MIHTKTSMHIVRQGAEDHAYKTAQPLITDGFEDGGGNQTQRRLPNGEVARLIAMQTC